MHRYPPVRLVPGSPSINTPSSHGRSVRDPRRNKVTQRKSLPDPQQRRVVSRSAMSDDRPFVEAAPSPEPGEERRAPAAIASARLRQPRIQASRDRSAVDRYSGQETSSDESDMEGEQQHNARASLVPPSIQQDYYKPTRHDSMPTGMSDPTEAQRYYSRSLHRWMSAQSIAMVGADTHPNIRYNQRSTDGTRSRAPLPATYQGAREHMKSGQSGQRAGKQGAGRNQSRHFLRKFEQQKTPPQMLFQVPLASHPILAPPSKDPSTIPLKTHVLQGNMPELDGELDSPSSIDDANTTKHGLPASLHRRFTTLLQSPIKPHLVAMLGEFLGTTMFLFFAFAGVQVVGVLTTNLQSLSGNRDGISIVLDLQKSLYVSLIFGASLAVNVWIFFRISGALFNPAVALALLLTQVISPIRAICLVAAEIVGGIVASGLVVALFPAPLAMRTTLSTSIPRGLFIEAILTAELVFTILMLAKEKHKATFFAPIGIGLALFTIELVGVQFTGGSCNPARSFGPDVVTGTFASSHWVYWLGPLLGTLTAVLLYTTIKSLEHAMANTRPDATQLESETNNHPSRPFKPSDGTHAAAVKPGLATPLHAFYRLDPLGWVSNDYHLAHTCKLPNQLPQSGYNIQCKQNPGSYV